MFMSPDALATTMRPLIVKLERAVSQVVEHGDVPTKPIPRIEANPDGSGKQWTDTDIDTWRLHLDAMPALETGSSLFVAEQLAARELEVDPPTGRDRQRPWMPQGEVVNVFLEDYLSAAYGARHSRLPHRLTTQPTLPFASKSSVCTRSFRRPTSPASYSC